MQLATLLKNMFLGDDHPGRATNFARVKQRLEGSFFTLNLEDTDNHLLQYLLWPMNTFHLIARILDTYDVYQKIVSIENETDYLKQLKTGNHARNWAEGLLNAQVHYEIKVSSRFHGLLYDLFSQSKAKMQVEELLKDPEYLKLLFELYVVSDECAYRIQNQIYRTSNPLVNRYTDTLVARKEGSIISSLSQSHKSNGLIQFKSHTPQAGISLSSLSHDLAYIKPGVDVAALVGQSTQSSDDIQYHVLILPWPLEVKDEFFQSDNRPTLQMDEEFGFFTYENHQDITCQMIMYAIESCGEQFPDLVVIPECAVNSNKKIALLHKLRDCFLRRRTKTPVIIFGVFGKGDSNGSYGENSLELLYMNRFVKRYVGENQAKHHRWALDKSQLNTYGLAHVLSTSKVKWWENCSTGDRKLISYRDDHIHLCPLICEDLARQDPIAPVVRALGPNLVVALLLDGPQMKSRWPGRYSSVLVDEPGCSVLSISPYGMTQRSTNGGEHPPSSIVALWSDTYRSKELPLDEGKVGIFLKLEFKKQKQWSADGRRENKNRLFYVNHWCIGDEEKLNYISLGKVKYQENTY
ncbi:hypothetical protein BEI46_14165 [Aliivibrio fischeri]|uniref:hypothetical protein n=1 Tax=Aliivibrio fischeri TaxID=668 RepID=UPI00084C78D3|nr:hypothetical protein [Aliivibrio fischeri]OED54676.1 hypothetical protein BEI46_14165 [Aliivibrio fischeri]